MADKERLEKLCEAGDKAIGTRGTNMLLAAMLGLDKSNPDLYNALFDDGRRRR